MYADRLELINVSEDRVLLKRGIHEVLVSGPAASSITGPLVKMLDGTRNADEILESFSEEVRDQAAELLQTLVRRGIVTEHPPATRNGTPEDLQSAFYDNLGSFGASAPDRLKAANVCIAGSNLISRALARSLAECGVGRIQVSAHPHLENEDRLVNWTEAKHDAGVSLVFHGQVPAEEALQDVSLICATSDFGEVDALLEMNRLAIRLNKPFLPVWLADVKGRVGPLNHPYETACFRCYRLRADSNNPNYEIARAVRRHMSGIARPGMSTGLLPPMANVLGEIAAMEIVKHLGQFVPVDTVGRTIEINLVSFSAVTRRVLKVPRCPECSDVMLRSAAAVTHGPQIPQGTGQR